MSVVKTYQCPSSVVKKEPNNQAFEGLAKHSDPLDCEHTSLALHSCTSSYYSAPEAIERTDDPMESANPLREGQQVGCGM